VVGDHVDSVGEHVEQVAARPEEVRAAAEQVQVAPVSVAAAAEQVQAGLDAIAAAAEQVQAGLDAIAAAAEQVPGGPRSIPGGPGRGRCPLYVNGEHVDAVGTPLDGSGDPAHPVRAIAGGIGDAAACTDALVGEVRAVVEEVRGDVDAMARART
jgi:hypothetical protein